MKASPTTTSLLLNKKTLVRYATNASDNKKKFFDTSMLTISTIRKPGN